MLATPDVEIRYATAPAWMSMGAGAIFFAVGLAAMPRSAIYGMLGCGWGIATILLGRNQRQNAMAMRMTSRELVAPLGEVVEWKNIAAVEQNTYNLRTHSRFICLKLKHPLAPNPSIRLGRLGADERRRIFRGYDVVIPVDTLPLSVNVDDLVAEMRRRAAVA